MSNQINFSSDIKKYSTDIDKQIKINDITLSLQLTQYNDKNICQKIKDWVMCLEMIGQGNMIKSKSVMSVIYCVLSDCCLLNGIDNGKIDLDLYDISLNKFLRIEVIDDIRDIKLRPFTVCDTLIVIDCKNVTKYKIYEVYNIKALKEYYEMTKINFDIVVADLRLKPKFIGNINGLGNDYKKLSNINFVIDMGKIIDELDGFLKNYQSMERSFMREYGKFYKSAIS